MRECQLKKPRPTHCPSRSMMSTTLPGGMRSAGFFSIVLAGAVSAQVQIQVQQAQPAQVQIQVQAQQVQIQQGRVMLPPVMQNQTRMMQAEAIFVGRVVAMEPMDVEAEPVKGQ